MQVTSEMVAYQLGLLGDNPVKIAKKLKKKGIKGRRYTASKCPITNYLIDSFGGEFTSSGLYIEGGEERLLKTPKPIAEFILAFDKFEFPELVTND
jgi:hypothetical protein